MIEIPRDNELRPIEPRGLNYMMNIKRTEKRTWLQYWNIVYQKWNGSLKSAVKKYFEFCSTIK